MKHRFIQIALAAAIALALYGIIMAAIYGISLYFKPAKDISEEKADVRVTASELYLNYEKDEQSANEQYLNKVIAVKGPVDEVTTNQDSQSIIILRDSSMPMGVSITMMENESVSQLRPGQVITIKGLCTGYQGMDMMPGHVILTEGSIVK